MTIQQVLPAVYWAVALGGTIFAFNRGAGDERAGALALLAASIASAMAVWATPVIERLAIIQTSIFVIDVALFVWLLRLALRSERFWPLWGAAFSLIVVATHVAHFVTPTIVPRAYILAQGFWAYPTWVAIMLGARHPWQSRVSKTL